MVTGTKKTTSAKKTGPEPGRLLHARERRLCMSTPQRALDGARSGRFIETGQACMIVGVLRTTLSGQPMELHGFVTPGAGAVGWLALPVDTAQCFWLD